MVVVTDKEYFLDPQLKQKLDLCIARSSGNQKMDNLIVIDGDEGFGKSTLAMSVAYYVAFTMKREFSVDNVFFDIDKMVEFARKTKDQVIVWDEAALGGLASDFRNKKQILLTKLLMVARKKRHFWIFCIPKFYKLNEYILVDRAIGLIHVYARKELQLGRFCYYNKKDKERLWDDKKIRKKRSYKSTYTFHGSFPNALSKVIDEELYDKKKDEAIMSIGDVHEVSSKWKDRFESAMKFLSTMPGVRIKDIMEHTGYSQKTISNWRAKAEKERQNL